MYGARRRWLQGAQALARILRLSPSTAPSDESAIPAASRPGCLRRRCVYPYSNVGQSILRSCRRARHEMVWAAPRRRRRFLHRRARRNRRPARAQRLGQEHDLSHSLAAIWRRLPEASQSPATTSMANSIAVRRAISYVPEDAPLYERMRVSEFLHFMAAIKGLRGRGRARRSMPRPAPRSRRA